MTAIITVATRWDAYFSNTPGDSAYENACALSDPAYQWRAPFFAEQIAPVRIQWNYSQASMDQEIAAANAGLVNCWAFLRYNPIDTSPMGRGLELYKSSTAKGALKWCSMDQTNTLGTTAAHSVPVARLVNEMIQPYYQTVGANRPLMFLYYAESEITTYWGGSLANLKTCLDQIRTDVQAAGRGNPYIVLLYWNNATRISLGADAIGAYNGDTGQGISDTYPMMATANETYWTNVLALGANCVPVCMAGWAREPMVRRPFSWQKSFQKPYFGLSRNMYATLPQLAAHAQAGIDFLNNNPTLCPYRIVLWYAWNEHSEGGWLCPTMSDPPTLAQPGGARLAALSSVLSLL